MAGLRKRGRQRLEAVLACLPSIPLTPAAAVFRALAAAVWKQASVKAAILLTRIQDASHMLAN